MIINAVKEVRQDKNIAFLEENHIERIHRAYQQFEDQDGFCKVVPVEEYLRAQGRFRHLSDEEIKLIQKQVDERWWKLVKKVEESKG